MAVLPWSMYVDRDLTPWFRKLGQIYNMIAVVGPRQAGKTTFLKRMGTDSDSIGGEEVSGSEKISYISFDDPDMRALFNLDVKKFEIEHLRRTSLTILDEVQYCSDAGSKLKYLVDSNYKMWITSSSEILLRKEILSFLVGRVTILRLYPFSIHEFLKARGVRTYTPEIFQRHVWEHMTYGGYPRAILTSDPDLRRTYLHDLYETMLMKDVAHTFTIPDTAPLERLVRYLAAINTGIISYETLTDDLNISYRTLKKYLDALTKSYFIHEVSPFSTNKKKEIIKQSKVYFIDTGLLNTIAKQFDSEPSGSLFENYVLTELLKMGFSPKFWRAKSKAEVDFIVEIENELVPVEVKLNATSRKPSRSFRSFIDAYGPKRGIIVSYQPVHWKSVTQGCSITFTDIMGLWEQLKCNEPQY